MSIPPKHFSSQLKKLSLLNSNYEIPKQKIDALYEYLMHSDINDFDNAIEHMARHEERITLANIQKWISYFQEQRLEKECNARKQKEAQEVKELLNKVSSITSHCEGYRCKTCSYSENCEAINNALLQATIDILTRKMDKQLIINNLIEKYPVINLNELETTRKTNS